MKHIPIRVVEYVYLVYKDGQYLRHANGTLREFTLLTTAEEYGVPVEVRIPSFDQYFPQSLISPIDELTYHYWFGRECTSDDFIVTTKIGRTVRVQNKRGYVQFSCLGIFDPKSHEDLIQEITDHLDPTAIWEPLMSPVHGVYKIVPVKAIPHENEKAEGEMDVYALKVCNDFVSFNGLSTCNPKEVQLFFSKQGVYKAALPGFRIYKAHIPEIVYDTVSQYLSGTCGLLHKILIGADPSQSSFFVERDGSEFIHVSNYRDHLRFRTVVPVGTVPESIVDDICQKFCPGKWATNTSKDGRSVIAIPLA